MQMYAWQLQATGQKDSDNCAEPGPGARTLNRLKIPLRRLHTTLLWTDVVQSVVVTHECV